MEHPKFRRAPNGTLLLKASPAAQALGPRQVAGGQALYRAKKPHEVDAEAWAHVASEGGDTANATLVLSRWKIQFGRFQGKTFLWLLENVGYSVNLVSSHQKERERTGSQSPLMANKDAFTRYSSAFPDFEEAVRFHRAFEEARERSLQPGQEGQALVGFGDFKFETLQSLYESEDSKKIRFVNDLRRKAPAPGTQMENAVQFVKSRDRQRTRAAAAAAASSTTSSSSSSSTTTSSSTSTTTTTSLSSSSSSTTTTESPAPSPPPAALQVVAVEEREELPCPAAPNQDTSPEAPEVPQQPSSDSEENIQGPDGQPGYQHVLKLAQALVAGRNLQELSDSRVDRLVLLWNRLPEQDKQRVVYPARYRERQPKGRFKAAKGKNTSCPGKESLQRCLLGLNSGPANWPSASRLVEAVCTQLCQLHPAATGVCGVTRTRWSLVLEDYVAIREAVLGSPRLMAQTEIQLFELNQRTLTQWFSRRQKAEGRAVLQQGTGIIPAAAVAGQPLPPAKGLSSVQVGQGQPFHFEVPDEQPGPSSGGLHHPPPPPPDGEQPGPSSAGLHPPSPGTLPGVFPTPAPAGQPPLPGPQVPRSTAYRKRKASEAAGQEPPPGSKTRRQPTQYVCSKCGQPKRLDTGHTRLYGVTYCASVGGKTVEEWKEAMKTKHEGGP